LLDNYSINLRELHVQQGKLKLKI